MTETGSPPTGSLKAESGLTKDLRTGGSAIASFESFAQM